MERSKLAIRLDGGSGFRGHHECNIVEAFIECTEHLTRFRGVEDGQLRVKRLRDDFRRKRRATHTGENDASDSALEETFAQLQDAGDK